MGRNETGWGNQGHANLNYGYLIADGKITPFIIVMENAVLIYHVVPTSCALPPGQAAPGRCPTNSARGPMGGYEFCRTIPEDTPSTT